MTAGQLSECICATALLDELPKAQWLLADRSYDADWFRDALEEKGITPNIPGCKSRNRRNHTDIMFGSFKDRRRRTLRKLLNRLFLRYCTAVTVISGLAQQALILKCQIENCHAGQRFVDNVMFRLSKSKSHQTNN